MNSLKYLLTAAIAAFLLFSCSEKESDIPLPKLAFSEKVVANFESISLSCTVNGNVSVDRLTIEYSKDQSLASAQKKSFEKSGDSFTVTISGLEIQTTYYYRYTVENKASVYTDETIREFKTLDYSAPEVTTIGAKDISGTMATFEGKVDFTCGKTILEQGFMFGKDKNHLETKATEQNNFSLKVEGLEFGTTYYYQAYAKSEIGTGVGEIKEMKTCDAVSFKPVEVKSATASSLAVSGGVKDNGGININKQGFRYSEGSSADFTFVATAGVATLSHLKADTKYKVWFYAKTFEGEFESEKAEFSTTDGAISFGDYTTTTITAASISLSTIINGDGGSPITERGFVYSTNSTLTFDGNHKTVAGTTGQMTGSLTNLTNNTAYNIRAYAKNGVGISYGSQITITTKSGLAEMGATTVSGINAESAKFNSYIVSTNGADISECGFCYSLNNKPTISDSKVTSSSASGTISATANSLRNNTKYFVRSFATTEYGTSYGDENTFTTKDGEITFTNLTISAIQPASATASVTISNDGGSSVTERGFCYATTAEPTVSDKRMVVSSTESTYSGTLSTLKTSTKYYVRAYAKNAVGTFYSEQISLTTMSGLASFGSIRITDTQRTSTTLSCEVTSDGGATITNRGFIYFSIYNYSGGGNYSKGNTQKKVLNGTVGLMQCSLTDLSPDSLYIAYPYATTQYGTTYDDGVLFGLSCKYPVPSSVAISNIHHNSATFTSGIEEGDGRIIEKGFIYSTSLNTFHNGINNGIKAYNEGTKVYVNADWSVTVTELEPNTKYYVCAFVAWQLHSHAPEVKSIIISNVYSFTTANK